MRNSKKVIAAAFVVTLSLATLSPATLHAATIKSRAVDPAPGFLKRLITEIRHALGISSNEDVVSVPRP